RTTLRDTVNPDASPRRAVLPRVRARFCEAVHRSSRPLLLLTSGFEPRGTPRDSNPEGVVRSTFSADFARFGALALHARRAGRLDSSPLPRPTRLPPHRIGVFT